ncbi:MAG: prephenate dehydrogenase/arogenate dehydrogenase family protein [Opitutales bacterium]|nr:prephenate dehydrogenase/arogenate dehydrogenase family protein [Opitutales bacterium]
MTFVPSSFIRPAVSPPFDNLAILAPGLLGASLAMAVRERGLARRITVWARRPEVRQACAESKWCDAACTEPEEAARDTDFVVVCTPVSMIAALAARVAPACRDGAILTDVGSTKSLICREATAAMPDGRTFVGSHPMAGSEKTGMDHARADLFAGRNCFVTPLDDTQTNAVDRAVRFWRDTGMDVATVSPEEHDEIVAHISHLPHILASVLSSQLAGKPADWPHYAGNGLRDTTRVAAGGPGLWRDILEQNREESLRAIEGFEDELHRLKAALHNRHFATVKSILQRGKEFRDRLS